METDPPGRRQVTFYSLNSQGLPRSIWARNRFPGCWDLSLRPKDRVILFKDSNLITQWCLLGICLETKDSRTPGASWATGGVEGLPKGSNFTNAQCFSRESASGSRRFNLTSDAVTRKISPFLTSTYPFPGAGQPVGASLH